jgi:hypothetical protein
MIMKKTIMLFAAIALTACKKEETQPTTPAPTPQDCQCDEVQYSRIDMNNAWTIDFTVPAYDVTCDSVPMIEGSFYTPDSLTVHIVDCW